MRLESEYTYEELMAVVRQAQDYSPQLEGGFFSSNEWASIWNTKMAKTRGLIRELLGAGLMERSIRYEETIAGANFPKPVYRITLEEKDDVGSDNVGPAG